MFPRCPVLGLFLVVGLAASAQTVLSESEYDQRKTAGTLPDHPVLVADMAKKSHPGAPKGGGGPCGCWVQPDASYTLAMVANDDLFSAAIPLPFTFTLFGDQYTELYINNNGNLSFIDPYSTFSSNSFPSADYRMVAPFWADVDTRDTTLGAGSNEVWYKVTPTAIYVNWVNVGYYNSMSDKLNTFQVIITDGTDPVVPGGNNVSFCYLDMQWTTGAASQGVNGFGGISATVGVNRGDGISHAQVGRFALNDSSYGGPYADTSGISWLDSTHFYLNTTNAGVPPIIGSGFACDSIVVQVNSSSSHQMVVIAGAPGQAVNCTSVCPGIASYQQVPTVPGEQTNVVFNLTPDASEVGQHLITFTAINDDVVPLTSTYQVLVEVVPALSTGLGDAGAEVFTIAPNPSVDQSIITLAPGSDIRTMRFFDAQGRRVLDLPVQAGSDRLVVDLAPLAKGPYLVVAEGPGQRAAQRVVVSR